MVSRGSLKKNTSTPVATGDPVLPGTGTSELMDAEAPGETHCEDHSSAKAGSTTGRRNHSKTLDFSDDATSSKREPGDSRHPPPPPPPYIPPVPPNSGSSPSSIAASNVTKDSSRGEKEEEEKGMSVSCPQLPPKRRSSQKKSVLSSAYSVDSTRAQKKFSNKDKVRNSKYFQHCMHGVVDGFYCGGCGIRYPPSLALLVGPFT